MKKTTIYILLIFLLISINSYVQAEESTINIVCTNSILADFTKNLVKENVSVDFIMPAGACPSLFDSSPNDVSKILSADIIISFGSEPWFNDLLEISGNKNYKEIRCFNLGEWNYPLGAKKYIETIENGLYEILPIYKDKIKKNTQEYMEQINSTFHELKNMIEINGFKGQKVICIEWHKDFLNYLGLNITYYYPPPERISTQDMINISNTASLSDVSVIIDNLQSGTDFGAHISSESGAIHIIFTNFPGAIKNTDTYLDMIEYNSKQLMNGISTYQYKFGEISYLESRVKNLEIERNALIIGLIILALVVTILIVLYKKKY